MLVWTFVFAILSVATTFALGLFLAIVFNDPRMKSKRFYRIVVILPYAFPGFLTALVWAGMFNQDFGIINQWFFGGAAIPWLQDPWLGEDRHPDGQPLAGLPVHVPGVHGRDPVHPG